jgi:kinesin family member 12
MAVVEEGNGNRRVASHLLNQDSSRSHSILTVYLQSEWADSVDGHIVKKFGKVGNALLLLCCIFLLLYCNCC